MSIVRRRDTWYLDITFKGKRIRSTCGTSDKKKAQEYHDKYKARLWRQEYLPETVSHSWDEAVVRWLELKRDKRSLGKDQQMIDCLSVYLKGKQLDEITTDTLITIMVNIQTNKRLNGSTINRYLSLVRGILRAAVKWGWLRHPPAVFLRKEKPREVYLTADQISKLLDYLSGGLRLVVEFALATGLRRSNIVALSKDRVEYIPDKGYFLNYPSEGMKSGKPFRVPLSGRAVELIKKANYSFTLTWREVKEFQKACKELGFGYIRFHDLRHTYASLKASQGVPLDVIKELMGHHSIHTTLRYRHLTVDNLREYV